jgi:putative transposase
VRDEFLNQHNFVTIADAQEGARAWLDDYNGVRPHSALGYLTPREFAAQLEATSTPHFQAA